ncbi:MAG TPA: hypothetical protein VNS58_25850 [Puia sp.]|nr:hypothetical protein [Puia sp.]
MATLKVVLDTNALLRSISRRSAFSIILDKLYEGEYELWVTNDILLENVLKSISFPSINVITLETFNSLLS